MTRDEAWIAYCKSLGNPNDTFNYLDDWWGDGDAKECAIEAFNAAWEMAQSSQTIVISVGEVCPSDMAEDSG